jgi:hypothetical protein
MGKRSNSDSDGTPISRSQISPESPRTRQVLEHLRLHGVFHIGRLVRKMGTPLDFLRDTRRYLVYSTRSGGRPSQLFLLECEGGHYERDIFSGFMVSTSVLLRR